MDGVSTGGDPLSKIQDEVLRGFLRDYLERIQELYAPRHLILFGSRARGTARPESDIDLILVSERFQGQRFPSRMGEFLVTLRPPLHVDALCYTPDEFERLRAQPGIVAEACREGIWMA